MDRSKDHVSTEGNAVTGAKTHHLVIWTVGSGREVRPRACADDTGALLAFATRQVADAFAAKLRTYALTVIVHKVSSAEVAELLAYNLGVPDQVRKAADRVSVVEAQTTDQRDAAGWARELADRFMRRLVQELADTSLGAAEASHDSAAARGAAEPD
jgi:hypothetical protein